MSEMYGYARVSSKDPCEERRRQGAIVHSTFLKWGALLEKGS